MYVKVKVRASFYPDTLPLPNTKHCGEVGAVPPGRSRGRVRGQGV